MTNKKKKSNDGVMFKAPKTQSMGWKQQLLIFIARMLVKYADWKLRRRVEKISKAVGKFYLPEMEKGGITTIGATTGNKIFEIKNGVETDVSQTVIYNLIAVDRKSDMIINSLLEQGYNTSQIDSFLNFMGLPPLEDALVKEPAKKKAKAKAKAKTKAKPVKKTTKTTKKSK